MFLALQVAPSGVTRTPSGVTITEGATSYQGIPKWDTFGLSALPVIISSYLGFSQSPLIVDCI